jgi:hypothetical protein
LNDLRTFIPMLTEEGEMRMAWEDHRNDEEDEQNAP